MLRDAQGGRDVRQEGDVAASEEGQHQRGREGRRGPEFEEGRVEVQCCVEARSDASRPHHVRDGVLYRGVERGDGPRARCPPRYGMQAEKSAEGKVDVTEGML